MLSIVIQAGGSSTRMGQDKALMPFLGRPLILRQIERLSALADELLVITNRLDAYAFLTVPLYSDPIRGLGPLGGLSTALKAAHWPYVAVVACDMPFVSADLLDQAVTLMDREGADVVVPRSPDGLEPLHAVYRKASCLPVVQAALEAGERKAISWFGQVQVRELSQEEIQAIDPNFLSFINVNSPEEFRQAEKLAGQIDLYHQ